MPRQYATPSGDLETHFTDATQPARRQRKRRYSIEDVHEERGEKNWWKYGVFVALGLGGILAVIILVLVLQRKEVPWVYQVEKGSGHVISMGPMSGKWDPIDDTIKKCIREFVKVLRRISEDVEAMKDDWKAMEWRVTKGGRTLLLDYLKTWKPLEQRDPIKVDNIQLFRRSGRSYDVRWQETKFDKLKRTVIDTWIRRGSVTFVTRPPERTEEKEHNPEGVFFDIWDWSEEK